MIYFIVIQLSFLVFCVLEYCDLLELSFVGDTLFKAGTTITISNDLVLTADDIVTVTTDKGEEKYKISKIEDNNTITVIDEIAPWPPPLRYGIIKKGTLDEFDPPSFPPGKFLRLEPGEIKPIKTDLSFEEYVRKLSEAQKLMARVSASRIAGRRRKAKLIIIGGVKVKKPSDKMYRIRWQSKRSNKSGAGPWFKPKTDVTRLAAWCNMDFPSRDYTVEEAPLDDRKIQ